MTQQGSDNSDPTPDDSRSSTRPSSLGGSSFGGSSFGGSSLGNSSLDDAREAADRDVVAPNPFSREAAPDEAMGADPDVTTPPPAPYATDVEVPPPVVAPAQSWPGYPEGPPIIAAENPRYGGTGPAAPYAYDSGAGAYDPGAGAYDPGAYDTGADGYGNNEGGYGAAAQTYGPPAGYPQTPAYGSNPYQVNPYQAAYGSSSAYGVVPQTHPQASVALILGIVGVTFCPLVGIGGLVTGSRVRKQIDAEPQRYSGRGLATAAIVLGIISIVSAVLWIIFLSLGFSGAFDS